MPFKRYVEIGRVALINYGDEYGKLVVISDVVDQNRALIDLPDEQRRVINFKRLSLTDFKIDIPRLAKKKVLREAYEGAEIEQKFAETAWGKKLASQRAKKEMNDFDRYKAMVEKKKKAKLIRKAFEQLKKEG
eukprot:TRINITY_DN4328_c1_g3_i1.p4 TRINITY_DN4328_c1_g3~~TRINITY_DN4328_c1_g3_i1.p4  ORF type:complete len:133 (-),score=27.74 TRINITY_DN4328_c1_g3_i1:294-692(-)